LNTERLVGKEEKKKKGGKKGAKKNAKPFRRKKGGNIMVSILSIFFHTYMALRLNFRGRKGEKKKKKKDIICIRKKGKKDGH